MAIFLVWSALGALSARAQIASYVDERGKRVFINSQEPVPRHFLNRVGHWQQKVGLEQVVSQTAERHRVDPALVRAVVETESSWNPSAVSRKGALGLMQLVPGTARRFGVANALDPQDNVEGGVRYLRMLLERYDGDINMALAAYNAGERAVDRFRGVPNFAETRIYVQKITDSYFRPGSGRLRDWWSVPRPIYRTTDERGRLVFRNE